MKRRDLLAASCVAGVGALGTSANAKAAPAAGTKEYLELRVYQMASMEKRDAYVAFLRDVAVPALNRIGIDRVGVWKMQKPDDPSLYVLLPHKSIASFATARQRLLADAKYLKDGAAVLNASRKETAFKRVESSLMLSFDSVPKVEVPTKAETRLFRFRIYESHSVERGQRKIEMFNTGGEVALFRKNGLNPVFFGETLIGTKMPNLTYMIGFDTPEAGEVAWKAFGSSPEWKKLSRNPKYRGTVSGITNLYMLPTAASQI